MKKTLLLIVYLIIGHHSYAQWNLNGSILENINVGDVVINQSSNLRLYGRLVTYYPKSNTVLGGEFLGTSGYWGFRTDTDNRFHIDIYNSNNPRSAFNIDQIGNVGIGTGIPNSQLHLTSNTDHAFKISRSNGMYGFQIFRNAQQGIILFQNTDDNNNLGTRIKLDEGGSGWRNVLINPDGGNVGIGVIEPTQTLDIVGRVKLRSDGYTSPGVWFTSSDGVQHAFVGQTDLVGTSPVGFFHSGDWRLLVNNNGNVGIGTINPTQKLTVNGTVYSTEVKVDVNAGTGPDYVFEPTYQLPSLTEIENYIKANKHLPEVPSAKEMETNGINLSEMNMLLLKKVEELTLYVIELKKENDEARKENEKQNQIILELINKK